MNDKSSDSSPALSVQKQSGCSGCFVWMFAIMFLAGGLGSGYFLTFQPLWGMLRSQNWIQTPCTIVSSELKHGDESASVAVTFKYSVDDKEYQSDRYCFIVMSTNTAGEWKRRVIADYPPGKPSTCFVDPNAPGDAVIERGWVPDMWWGLFPIPFTLIGLIAFLAAIGLIRAPRTNTSPQTNWSPKAYTSKAENGEDGRSNWESSGPVTLAPEATPFQMLIGSIIVAAIWNAIVSVFVWGEVQQVLRGGFGAFNWFQSLFLVPFVLVGLGLILFVVYSLLSLLNPRPTLIVNSAAIPLGEELTVTWSLSGRPGSIREFKISLKGIEKATYRRGTTTTTDKSTFADIEIFETTDVYDMESGTATITVPDDSMHTFDAPNNKIVWTLHVLGDIPWWPNVSAAFPITVLPQIRDD